MDYKEKVIAILNSEELSKEQKEKLEEIFPELKESEDERVREALIHLVNSNKELSFGIDNYDGIKWGDILAWLEKQGEPDILIEESYQQQADDLIDMVTEKSAWSEEDEKHIESILKRLDGMCKKGATFTKTYFILSQDMDWLKSLKDRVQPKQEWSEEDELRLDDIKIIIEESIFSKVVKDKNLNWLKSLRPQSQWKPSAFHLGCITDAISMYKDRGINAIGLKEILDELKKLKEE